jgi:hypothetical protein
MALWSISSRTSVFSVARPNLGLVMASGHLSPDALRSHETRDEGGDYVSPGDGFSLCVRRLSAR